MWRAVSRLCLFLICSSGAAQVLNVGNDVTPNSSAAYAGEVATLIDLARPATATGTISAIRYYWPTGPCPSAFKIKFFHRTGDTLKMSEERGPFGSSTSGPGTIALSAPVAVLEGDLIGITSLTTCGNATALYGSTPSDGYVAYRGDVTGSVTVSGGTRRPDLLPVFGSGSATESVRGVITVAGSTAGGFGSNFKTSVQLLNPLSDGTLTGRIDFRPAGNPERNGALLYSLGPGQIVSYSDIVASMGQSGLGSIDVVVTAGQSAPLFLVRVYNDAGIAGTSGLTEEVVDPEVTLKGVSSLLTRGKSGFLMTPIDPARTRLNIGVRTLSLGATVRATLKDSAGSTLITKTRTYAPNWFEQIDAASFLGSAIAGNQSILIEVSAGSAIVYGATTDNTTNDPAVQFVHVIFSS